MSTQALPPVETVEDVFNLLETEITLLGEYLDPSFFEQFDVFAPDLVTKISIANESREIHRSKIGRNSFYW